MPEQFRILTESAYQTIRRIIGKVDNANGPGVTNAPDSLSFNPQVVTKGGEEGRRRPPLALARITAIHKNYFDAKILTVDRTTGAWSVPADAPTVYVAKHPFMQATFYDGKTVTDPVSAANITFSYQTVNTREADNGTDAEAQRAVPWYTTDADDAPTIVAPTGFVAVNDGGSGVVQCSYIEMGPRYWAKV